MVKVKRPIPGGIGRCIPNSTFDTKLPQHQLDQVTFCAKCTILSPALKYLLPGILLPSFFKLIF